MIGWGFDGGVGLGEAGLIAESLQAESQSSNVTIEIRLARREQKNSRGSHVALTSSISAFGRAAVR